MVGERFHWDPENPNSCKLKKLNTLPVFSIYIVESAKFVKNYPEQFSLASENPNSFVYVRVIMRRSDISESRLKNWSRTKFKKDENNIIPDYQHGFRARRSCTTLLCKTLDNWASVVDQKAVHISTRSPSTGERPSIASLLTASCPSSNTTAFGAKC
jgi:hypothetical protein